MANRARQNAWLIGLVVAAIAAQFSGLVPARAGSEERATVHVVVKDAVSDQPINQARLTLRFSEGGGARRLGRDKKFSFSAKTNPSGRYKFTGIPKGTVLLMVTAEQHQSFGKEFEIELDDQVIEVKLKKPRPLL